MEVREKLDVDGRRQGEAVRCVARRSPVHFHVPPFLWMVFIRGLRIAGGAVGVTPVTSQVEVHTLTIGVMTV